MKATIHFPACDDDALSTTLCELTKFAANINPNFLSHGFLGGEFGYGFDWSSDVFQMHPYCWCENEKCPWCCSCDCDESSLTYEVDGVPTSHDEYRDFFKRETGEHSNGRHDEWMRRAAEANRRRREIHTPKCEFCLSGGPAASSGGGPGLSAPNFWHKPTGLKVWWYKYIGRDMDVLRTEGVDLMMVYKDCCRDVRTTLNRPSEPAEQSH